MVQIKVLKEIVIAALELSMTDGEFVFVGCESDLDDTLTLQPIRWSRPDFKEEPSKYNPDPFATYDIIFFKAIESPVETDECR